MAQHFDVVVIGAGPAGAVASADLARRGRRVLCLEQAWFPRWSIGESLLPRCNALLDQVGLLPALEPRGYITKRGATFLRGDEQERFCFAEALDGDLSETWQVPRDDFDQALATAARRFGAEVRFGQSVQSVESAPSTLQVHDAEADRSYAVRTDFILDCSGFGRVLPRLLDLVRPSAQPERVAAFTHVEGDRRPTDDSAGDIWICSHPGGGWIWIIPFSNGRTSVGAVCDPAVWNALDGPPRDRLQAYIAGEPNAAARVADAAPVAPTRVARGFGAAVAQRFGPGWALAGNTGDFLDPIFSSGVTLAVESACLAAPLIDRQLAGETIDWATAYDAPIQQANGVFRAFVDAWYTGALEDIFFAPTKAPRTKRRITSILGGHVQRMDNPLVADPVAGLARLHAFVSGR